MNIKYKNSVRNALKDKSHCLRNDQSREKLTSSLLYFISIILATKQTEKILLVLKLQTYITATTHQDICIF